MQRDVNKIKYIFRRFLFLYRALIVLLIALAVFGWYYRGPINIFIENVIFVSQQAPPKEEPSNADIRQNIEEPAINTASYMTPPAAIDTSEAEAATGASEAVEKQSVETTVVQIPSSMMVLIKVVPEDNSTLKIDGAAKSINSQIPVKPGWHDLIIENPYYPIYKGRVNIDAAKTLSLDLTAIYSDCRRVNIIVGASRKLQSGTLAIRLNGFNCSYQLTGDGLPYVNLCAGLWRMEFMIRDADGSPMPVNSIKTFPYTENGPRRIFDKNPFEIDLGGREWDNLSEVEMTIF